MILWFGKKKKKQELEAEGKRIEAEEAARKAVEQAEAEAQAEAARQAAELAAAEANARMAAEAEAVEAAPVQAVEHAPTPEPVLEVSEPEAPEPDGAAAETKSRGFFSKLATGLKRSSSKLSDGITGVFTKRKLDTETLEELEDLLIMSDMGTAVARRVTQNIAKDRFEKEISDEEIKTCLLYTSPSPRDS